MGKQVTGLAVRLGVAAAFATVSIAPLQAATTVYGAAPSLLAALGSSAIVDDYENPGYAVLQNDAAMSAVLGETKYTAITHPGVNFVFGLGTPLDATGHSYCAGCDGSFVLDFTGTSVATANGIFGFGFDYYNDVFSVGAPYSVTVTFGDDSVVDYGLIAQGAGYFGLTSDLGIKSLLVGHQGVAAPGGNTGSFIIDNLAIGASGAVPEPASWAMMIAGLGVLGAALRRQRARTLAFG